MRQTNPAVIARNHRVELAIDAAVEHKDFEPFQHHCKVFNYSNVATYSDYNRRFND
jgi:uncharacterized protein YdiU (UPF0061 family)